MGKGDKCHFFGKNRVIMSTKGYFMKKSFQTIFDWSNIAYDKIKR